MTRKAVFLSILLIALTVGLMSGSTYAFFTDSADVSAGLETGTVRIQVQRYQSLCDGGDTGQRAGTDAEGSGKKDPPGGGDGGQSHQAAWKITNIGSLPVDLHSVVTPTWTAKSSGPHAFAADVPSSAPSAAQTVPANARSGSPSFAPGSAEGWDSVGEEEYTWGFRSQKVLQPKQSEIFSLPFEADGPPGTRYDLNVCLKVTAVQAGGPTAAAQEEDESSETEDIKGS